MTSSTPMEPVAVAAFYRFAPVADPATLRDTLDALCRRENLRGTILVAPEGINGTVAGSEPALEALFAHLDRVPGFEGIEPRRSSSQAMPFHRMKVRLKREIVTMGVDDLDTAGSTGDYVDPTDWNALLDDPDVLLVDTRNTYETALGTFEGATDPALDSFRAFPGWAERNRDQMKGRKVAMFCTGGIRCEKATAYVRALGVEEVFHLRGGILAYLEQVPAEDSRWRGECFVFDERVSVGPGLAEGEAELCRACRWPLTAADRASPLFAEGVACPRCHASRTEEDRERYAERHRQVGLAERRGRPRHIGR